MLMATDEISNTSFFLPFVVNAITSGIVRTLLLSRITCVTRL